MPDITVILFAFVATIIFILLVLLYNTECDHQDTKRRLDSWYHAHQALVQEKALSEANLTRQLEDEKRKVSRLAELHDLASEVLDEEDI